MPMKKGPKRKVYCNDYCIGVARNWDEALSVLYNFADGLFCSAASFADGHNNTTTRARARMLAFLSAMGIEDVGEWFATDENTEEGENFMRFIFPDAGRIKKL